MQGMAMGAQANIVDSVHIFIAIAAHKGLAAYALGSSVVDSQVSIGRIPAFAYAFCIVWLSRLLLSAVQIGKRSCRGGLRHACWGMQASMRKFWTVIGFFASATPVGIMLGVLLSNVANSDAAASVSALASGKLRTVLLYLNMMMGPRPCSVRIVGSVEKPSRSVSALQWYAMQAMNEKCECRHVPVCGIHGGDSQRACCAEPSHRQTYHAHGGICGNVHSGHMGIECSPEGIMA